MAKRISEQERREKALMGIMAKHAAEMGLHTDKDVAELLGISPESYGQYKRKKFQTPGFLLFCKIVNKLQLDGREICTITGAPYASNIE